MQIQKQENLYFNALFNMEILGTSKLFCPYNWCILNKALPYLSECTAVTPVSIKKPKIAYIATGSCIF